MSLRQNLELFRRCLHYEDCSNTTRNTLYEKLPKLVPNKSLDLDEDPPKQEQTRFEKYSDRIRKTFFETKENTPEPVPDLQEITLKTYIDSTRQKYDRYSDYPPMLDTRAGLYKINMNTLRWFFKRGERLDADDIRKILTTNKFYQYKLGLSELDEILEHSNSKSSMILDRICDAVQGHGVIKMYLKKYISKGVLPSRETFDTCTNRRYRNASVDEIIEIVKILETSHVKLKDFDE